MLGLQQTVLRERRTPPRVAARRPMEPMVGWHRPPAPVSPRQLALTVTPLGLNYPVAIFVYPQLHLRLRYARLGRIRLYLPKGVSRNGHDPADG